MKDYDENKDDVEQKETEAKENQEELSEVEKLRQEIQENMNGWQRARADYANLQKEHSKQIENLKSYIVSGVVEDLLPVLDSFGMAMGNKEVWEKVDQNWRIGIEYILKQFNDTLDKYGVSEIQVQVGDRFDPELHQAMDSVETDDESLDGTIESVMQKGYKMKDTIIRPVKVKTYQIKK